MNLQRQHRNDEGFTLIELLIVMSIMLVLMAIAIPNALKLYKQANETSAQASIKTIGQAEMQYNSAYPQNGFSCGLAALGGTPGTAPSATAAQVIDPTLASGSKSGYLFNITNCHQGDGEQPGHVHRIRGHRRPRLPREDRRSRLLHGRK